MHRARFVGRGMELPGYPHAFTNQEVQQILLLRVSTELNPKPQSLSQRSLSGAETSPY